MGPSQNATQRGGRPLLGNHFPSGEFCTLANVPERCEVVTRRRPHASSPSLEASADSQFHGRVSVSVFYNLGPRQAKAGSRSPQWLRQPAKFSGGKKEGMTKGEHMRMKRYGDVMG